MPKPLSVLLVDDAPADAEMVVRALQQSGFSPVWWRVDTEAGFLAALHDSLDVIISDSHLKQFDAVRALDRLQSSGLDVPVIIVSGTPGEDTAVAVMKHGATDYLRKDRPERLGQAVAEAVEQRRRRREQPRITSALGRVGRFSLDMETGALESLGRQDVFPVTDAAVTDGRPEDARAHTGHAERVLFVDDEEAVVEVSAELLERLGYHVDRHTDVTTALAAFQAAPDAFDAVVTDLSMPTMSGLELARVLLRLRPDVPILLASGCLLPEDEEAARQLGIWKTIAKPATISELGPELDRLFTLRRDRAARARLTAPRRAHGRS